MPQRRWLEQDEVEAIVEFHLRRAGLWPTDIQLRIDIEAFVEIYLGASVDYGVTLDQGTLGYTVLTDPPQVVVDKRLTDLAHATDAPLGLRGRWRATLAHEAAHLILHRPDLQGRTPTQYEAQTDDEPLQRYDRGEVQANMGMAALLMPRQPFLWLARELLEQMEPAFLPIAIGSPTGARLIRDLANAFETSHEATRRRLILFGLLLSVGT